MAHEFRYETVQLYKTHVLGTGSYGAVCRAKCDDLPCAAKILHQALFQFNDPGAASIVRKFEQECDFLSGIRHPNIVQYLGSYRDPESRLPVLLMELLDESLTKFLERSQRSPPYHTQVNICHDIALALSYLHLNDIVHRDLSSNNVLLIAGKRVKLTDFGMAKLFNISHRITPMTMCPGTLVYMSPEALRDPPTYRTKLDCFSFGVLEIQIMTREFPDPNPAVKLADDPRYPMGRVQVLVPETERRKSHIDLIDPTHPLLPTAIDCLSYNEGDRPSAQEICHRLAVLKEAPQYGESVHQAQQLQREGERTKQTQVLWQQVAAHHHQLQEKNAVIAAKEAEIQQRQWQHELRSRELGFQIAQKDELLREKDEQLQGVRQQADRQLQLNHHQLQEKNAVIATREHEIRQLQSIQSQLMEENEGLQQQFHSMMEENQGLRKQLQSVQSQLIEENEGLRQQLVQKDGAIEVLEREQKELSQQLRSSEHEQVFQQNHVEEEVVRDLLDSLTERSRQIRHLEQQLQAVRRLPSEGSINTETTRDIQLRWREGRRVPEKVYRGAATVDGRVAYFISSGSGTVYAYDSPTEQWSTLPHCPHIHFSLAVINGLLTAVGGELADEPTNVLLSLTGSGNKTWSKTFPPMPTKRYWAIAMWSGKSLIVAGGTTSTTSNSDNLAIVEVMDTETRQWFVASSLPHPFACASATVSQGHVYMLGGLNQNGKTKTVLACLLTDLLRSCRPRSLRAHLRRALSLTNQPVWRKVADQPAYFSSCDTLCGQLLAVGGLEEDDNPTSIVHKYNSMSNSWEVIGHMETARYWPLVAVLPSNKVMVGGGNVGLTEQTDAVEIGSIM